MDTNQTAATLTTEHRQTPPEAITPAALTSAYNDVQRALDRLREARTRLERLLEHHLASEGAGR